MLLQILTIIRILKNIVLQDKYLYSYHSNSLFLQTFIFSCFSAIEVTYTKAHKSGFRVGNLKIVK